MTNEIKLKHEKLAIHGMWAWECPICRELLAPHEAGKGKGHQVLQSKGIATKHLIAHNAGYVIKGKSTTEIISQNQYFCNKCDSIVQTKKQFEHMGIKRDINWKPEHKYICVYCIPFTDQNWSLGLKTKEEVHKGKM